MPDTHPSGGAGAQGPDLAAEVARFVNDAIIPEEPLLAAGGAPAEQALAQLRQRARAAGLWGLFHPAPWGGRIGALARYLPVAEQEGRSEHGPVVLGGRVTLDMHMLHRHASAALRERFLAPMAAGEAVGAYGMSEPDGIGSIPATLRTTARLAGERWIINGRKWFISRARQAAFVTVVARTEQDGPLEQALSMIVVPTDAAGFAIERDVGILGQAQGQCELSFNQVEVPAHCLLGPRGGGLALMQQRLGLGRTLNAIHWTGLAQRCFDLMCARICSPRGTLARLADKQLMRLHVFNVQQAIVSARAQLRLAAERLDAQADASIEVNMAKVAASRALGLAVDSAIQVFGAEGLTDGTPLSAIYRTARTTRILDGTDEVLINTVGRQLLAPYAAAHSSAARGVAA